MQGVAPDYLQIRIWPIQDGIAFTDQDVNASAKVCLIGQTVVSYLFPDGSDPLGKTIRFKDIPFRIIGVLSKKGTNTFGQDQDDVILAPLSSVMKRILATIYYQTFLHQLWMKSTDKASDEIDNFCEQATGFKREQSDDVTGDTG